MVNLKTQLTKARFRFDHAQEVLRQEASTLQEALTKQDELKQAVQVVQVVAQAVQQAVHQRIANVVTDCLEAVFDFDAYQFKILIDRKGNRTEARLVFERDGLEVDPMTAAGGGTVDVAAFGLRVACISLMRDVEQVLILDEFAKFVSKHYRPRVRLLLETLSKKLGIQIVLVTHADILRTGKVLDLGDLA